MPAADKQCRALLRAVLFLGERLAAREGLGIAMVAAGVVVLAFRR